MITRAVIVQINTVSINGSNKATKPSEAEYLVFTAECAIDAEPAPASLENAALLKPTNNTPINPPTPIAVGLKASLKIKEIASSIKEKFIPKIYKQANTYNPAINGTTFSVTCAILLIPPIIIIPTKIAKTTPIIAPAAVLSKPNNSFNTTVAWLDCAALPPPNEPPIQKIAKTTAAILPTTLKPLSFRPLLI